jgi:hypothetical protein
MYICKKLASVKKLTSVLFLQRSLAQDSNGQLERQHPHVTGALTET